ncbi:MAG: hypothetical protein JWP36_100 [Paucimonas sp.]|nr:hypothetical protein [Paucimonas sp.]
MINDEILSALNIKSIAPDRELQQQFEATAAYRDQNMAVQVRQRLELLHGVCREHFESGERDFSRATLFAKVSPLWKLNDSYALLRTPYSPLIQAWATFCGGHIKTPIQVQREQGRQETVNYIEHHFETRGWLPSWQLILQDGCTTFLRGEPSDAGRVRHVHLSMEQWKLAFLANVPLPVQDTCDRYFDDTSSIPTSAFVYSALNEFDKEFDENWFDAAIERWRKCRLATELWRFSPTTDEYGLRWLELHPELALWRPMVIEYLGSLISDNVRKPAKLALHVFFTDYLLEQGLPLTPQKFLSNGSSPPAYSELCKHLSDIEMQKRCLAIAFFIEHVLDRGEGFFEIDSHGHRIRTPGYRNPLPWTKHGVTAPERPAKVKLRRGLQKDADMSFLTYLNPQLEQWRAYAVSWISSVKANVGGARTAIKHFIVDYIVNERLPTDPSVLLSLEWQKNNTLPLYRETALHAVGLKHAGPQCDKAAEFLDYVLETYYSADDDFGRRTVSGDYHNFLIDQAGDIVRRANHGTHSNKDVLPSRYIRYLRELVCPEGSQYLRDLVWAHNALPLGDWFEVEPSMIDEQDPDCVWRVRTRTNKTANAPERPSEVYELWSPARAIALMVKLELPMRTYQVRMLDSGEADTWRYEGSTLETCRRGEAIYHAGSFVKNNSSIVPRVGKTERSAGVFRRMPDALSGKVFTGLYVNTNKTQDRGKDNWDRGYVIPWQHSKVLYWCEKLRNWQAKYNSVKSLTPCLSLPEKVFSLKSDLQKQQMGSMCFLFRDPTGGPGENAWPITDSKLSMLWTRALEALETICAEKGHTGIDGARIQFLPGDKRSTGAHATFYSLHSLRVSLITHLATEGGVEMHILSECIAGHARILMTLYYKKSGVVYVSEAMEAASFRLKEETVEQKNWIRWLKEATIKQLEVNSAAVDMSVIGCVKDAFNEGAPNLLRTNLGICAKSGMACDTGGTIMDEDTGKISHGVVPGYPQQKNCVRCRWFLTGPAFLQALVHHWNLMHFNLGENGHRYLKVAQEVAELEASILSCQKLGVTFEGEARLENLRHSLSVLYDGNEKLASDSLATMKLIVRCKHIIDAAKDHDSGVVLIALGGIDEVTINVRECSELEQVLTAAVGSTIYVDEDAHRAVLKAGNAFDRMLAMNGKDPVFFKISEDELPKVVSHMTKLLQAYTGSISRAVPFVEGVKQLSSLGLFGDTDEILRLGSAGLALQLSSTDDLGPILVPSDRETIPSTLKETTVTESD